MSNNSFTNPAERIFAILKATESYKLDNTIMKSIWAEIYGVPEDDTGELLRLMMVFANQVENAIHHVQSIEGVNQNLFLKPLLQIQKTISLINLHEAIKGFRARLGAETLSTLEYTAEFLRQKLPGKDLTDKKLISLIKSLGSLSDEILNSDIEDNYKRALIEHLEKIRRSIIDYKLSGAEGILDTLDNNLGFIIRSGGQTSQKPTDKGVLTKLIKTLQDLYQAVSYSTKLVQLASGPIEHLLK